MKEDKYMENFRVLEIKQSVFEDNDHQANLLREELKKKESIFTKFNVITRFR